VEPSTISQTKLAGIAAGVVLVLLLSLGYVLSYGTCLY